MKYQFLIFAILILFGCKENIQDTREDVSISNNTTYIDLKGNKYEHLGQIPPNLRTPEQMKLIEKLNEITVNYMSVKNNHMVFNLSKKQFVAMGIPARFYEILEKNIRDNNDYFDANGIKDVDKMVEERKKTYNLSLTNSQ